MRDTSERIVFDTDSGFFNDDGAALAMLVNSGRARSIEAITITPGNTWPLQGAAYMLALLEILHATEIPVSIGAGKPLVHSAAMASAAASTWGPQQYTGAFAVEPPASKRELQKPFYGFSALEPASRNAVDMLTAAVDRHPGQVTVLALGPMTNVALALTLRPDIAPHIARLVFMGGAVHVRGNTTPAAEFNFWFDPEAARIVLRSAIPAKVMVGLDLCNHAPLTRRLFEEIAGVKTPLTALYEHHFARHTNTFLWDELAAAYLIDPSFVTEDETMYLDVDTCFGPTYGKVTPLERHHAPDATPVNVLLDLDTDRAYSLYKRLLTAAPAPRDSQ